ncbi:THO complex subunit 2-like protein isoform X2 [Tachypleus tridentatus]|uniref:THO complex subunit 2-like protein isoform X2 n=1 Tax=Tachypleus tridentatus TaxID=6853 RepID=UPI003FD578E9
MAVSVLGQIDLKRNWEKNGKLEFIKTCSSLLTSKQVHEFKQLIHELCTYVLHGTLRLEPVLSVLVEVKNLQKSVPSIITDILVLLDWETQSSDIPEHRERFFWLISGCCKRVIPESLLKERLDFETSADAGIVKVKRNIETKFIKVKTKLFYKQQKFNLFREESEGFAKLITELIQEVGGTVNTTYLLEVIRSLIGCFNLDPNRVLDVILESFECCSHLPDFYIPLLQSFMCNPKTLSQVLGFKLTFYQNDLSLETPATLYKVIALLLQNELINLDEIYGVLMPQDSKMIESYKNDIQAAKIYARRANFVMIPLETKEEQVEEETFKEDNQKLGLCSSLLDIGDWKHASAIMERLPELFTVSHPSIHSRLAKLISAVVELLYRRSCRLPSCLGQVSQPEGMNVKTVSSFVEFHDHAIPMILSLGPYLHTDPVLMAKIVRICKAYLNQDEETSGMLKYAVLNVIHECLLPSLALLDGNCCMSEELWGLLKMYPYQKRFRLYSLWKSDSHQGNPLLIRGKADTLKKVKYIMKRLSKENVKPSGRQLGKLSHSNPCILFEYVLSQIQTWDNLILPVVDSLKYLTSLSYDVLAYCIIEALSNPEKEKMKHDGTSISLWLQSLSSFCGAIFKKYPVELTGLLQYVANQLKAEKSVDLLVLKEIVQKMAGIEATEEITPQQLESMAGGELLRAEGGFFNQMLNTKKSSQRLKDSLLEHDLAIPLCLLMAQQRNCTLYHEQDHSHLKLVGKLYDQCQDTLVQFGLFLANSLSMEDYASRLPPVQSLLSDYSIQADIAFFLARPMLNYAINAKFEEKKKQDKSLKNAPSSQKVQKYVEAVEEVICPTVESVRPLYPSKTWDDISPQFFVTFWSLAMYDLYVPTTSYEREISKLKNQISQAEDNKDLVQSKKKKEKERCQALIEKLTEEEKRQQEHTVKVLARLKKEKDMWFQSRSAKNETITQFLQLCIFPRCIFTATDAVYCAAFVQLIHTLKTPNFSTLICYDRIFCDITYTVTSCTENEANRYGRFLCSMLETVMRWHSDKTVFDKECTNYPGFMTKFRGATQTSDSATDHVDYENYRHVCHKWHFKITKALVICLESGDYIQIRNSLIILTKILPYFPVITNLGLALERRIEKIREDEKEKRPDLYAIATGYSGQMKAKKNSLILEHEFHLMEHKDGGRTSLKNETGVKTAGPTCVKDKDLLKSEGAQEKDLLKSDFSKTQVLSRSTTSSPTGNKKDSERVQMREGSNQDVCIGKEGKKVFLNAQTSKGKDEKRTSSKNIGKVESEDTVESVSKRDKKDDSEFQPRDNKKISPGSYTTRRNVDSTESDRDNKRRRVDNSHSKLCYLNITLFLVY